MKILFIGDIVGKPGRRAVAQALPELRKKNDIDLVIANGENSAHGRGVTKSTLNELFAAGVDLVTSGNHWFDQPEAKAIVADTTIPFIRPANYPAGTIGSGYRLVTVRTKKVLVINLMGQVFMHQGLDNPFKKLDALLQETAAQKPDAIIVDFHADATSEAMAFSFYADGRISAALGTHTHVPTDDAMLLPKGTGHVADVGMVGPRLSVLGIAPQQIINHFLHDQPFKWEIPETGEIVLNYALVELDDKRNDVGVQLCKKIERHTQIITLK
ncbi:MAG: TIGR00282 family metallophosphoesterase [Candidatus Andersenbacteria bacterium]